MSEAMEQMTFLEFEEEREKEMEEKEEDGPVDQMSEKDRIEFIRDRGTDAMRSGLQAVFQENRWKPKREEMWEERLDQGRRMVRTILERED